MISICCLSWQFILQDQTDNHTPDNDDVCFFIPWDKDRMKIRRRDEKIETKIERQTKKIERGGLWVH
jgi:hypothetical protein